MTAELRGRSGRLWGHAPHIDGDSGLISSVRNCTRAVRGGTSNGTGSATPLFAAAAFNRRGDVLCAVSQHGQIFALFVTQNRYEIIKHVGISPTSVVASPTRSFEFLVGFADGSVRCYDVGAVREVCTLSGHKSPVTHVDVSRNGGMALSASRDAVILWNTATWQRVRVLGGGVGVAQAAFVSAAGGPGAASRDPAVGVYFLDGTFMAWDSSTLELRAKLMAPDSASNSAPTCFAASADGSALATASASSSVHVWEMRSQVLASVVHLPQSSFSPSVMTFVPGSRTLATLDANGAGVLFADVTSSKCNVLLEITPGGGAAASFFCIDPRGEYLAAGCDDGTLQLFDIGAAKQTRARTDRNRLRLGVPKQQVEKRLRAHATGSGTFGQAKYDRQDNANNENTATDDDDEFSGLGAALEPKQRIAAQKKAEPAVTPLYRLAKLDPAAQKLNRRRLKALLSTYGEYPAKYRQLIWRFALRLPENRDAYARLVEQGTHASFKRLDQHFPVKSRTYFNRLQRLLSCLAHWSPIMGQVPYLPAIAFPFAKAFGADEIVAFECVMCVMVHWGKGWLDMFPHPPVPVLNVIESLLERHDEQLHRHFVNRGVNSQTYAWSLLRSLFTEVLSSQDWLRFCDQLFTFPNEPQLLLVAVVAFLKYFRTSLLAAQEEADFRGFFHTQQAIDMERFTSSMRALLRASPKAQFKQLQQDPVPSLLASRTGGANYIAGFATHVNNAATADVTEEKTPSKPLWPLPEGEYPSFHRFSQPVADFQMRERERMAMDEEDIERKRKLDEQMRQRMMELEEQEELWHKQHEAVKIAEETRMAEMTAQQQHFAAEKRRVEQSIRAQRMEEAARLEESAKQRLKAQMEIRELQQKRMDAEVERIKSEQASQIESQLEEEALRNMESQASQRACAVMEQHEREEAMLEQKQLLLSKEQEIKASDRLRQESWRADDEQDQLRAAMKRQQLERMRQLREMQRQRSEMEHKFHLQQLEAATKQATVERERRLRKLAEEQTMELEAAEAEVLKEDEVRAREAENATKALLNQETAWQKQKAAQRMQIVEQEKQRLALETEKRQRMIRELEVKERKREYEDKLAAAQQLETEESIREEKQMQKVLLELEEERRKHKQTHLNLILEAQLTEDRLAFAKAQREAEAEVIAQERAHFDSLRADMRRKHEREMTHTVSQHASAQQSELASRDEQLLGDVEQQRSKTRTELAAAAERWEPDSDDESLSADSSDDSARLATAAASGAGR